LVGLCTFSNVRRLAILVFVVGGLLFVGAAAQASSFTAVLGSPNVVTFQAEPGETNILDVNTVSAPFAFSDSGAELSAGGACVAVDQHSADCSSATNGAYAINAYLGDRDDSARVVSAFNSSIWAGRGNDTVYGDSFGMGGAHVYGEAGDDTITAHGEGGQLADGGPGNDVIYAGGFVGSASAFGGSGNDTIYAQWDLANQASGTLDGGVGNDTIIAQPTGFASSASGGGGNDTIAIQGPAVSGPAAGAYTISGGPGNDSLSGGVGSDTVNGGTGDDYIDVRGGGSDAVTCGSGRDVVLYDASDTVARDCETRVLG